jgi:hypothetical protein
VVIDVLEAIAPRASGRNGNQYAKDYAMVASLQRLAQQRRMAILLVHHTTKARYEHVIDEISGTTGLTAAADTIIVLTRARGEGSILHVRGRDVARQALAVAFDPAIGTWTLVGEAKEHAISPERQAILRVLKESTGPMRPAEVARSLGASRDTTRQLMW